MRSFRCKIGGWRVKTVSRTGWLKPCSFWAWIVIRYSLQQFKRESTKRGQRLLVKLSTGSSCDLNSLSDHRVSDEVNVNEAGSDEACHTSKRKRNDDDEEEEGRNVWEEGDWESSSKSPVDEETELEANQFDLLDSKESNEDESLIESVEESADNTSGRRGGSQYTFKLDSVMLDKRQLRTAVGGAKRKEQKNWLVWIDWNQYCSVRFDWKLNGIVWSNGKVKQANCE